MQVLKLLEACEVYQPKTIPKKDLIEDGKYFVYGANGKIGRFNEYNHSEEEVLLGCRGSVGSLNISEPYSWITGNAMVVKPKSNQLLKKYIYYFLNSLDKKNIITGSSIPQITRKSLETTEIPVPSLKEQDRIVERLDRFEKLILQLKNNRHRQIQEYEKLKKSLSYLLPNENTKTLKIDDITEEYGRGKSKHRPRNFKGLYGGKYPFIQTGDVRKSKIFITDYKQTYNEMGLNQSKLWPAGTICLNIAANIGDVGILTFDACFPDSILGIKANTEIVYDKYLYFLLFKKFDEINKMSENSTAQKNFNLQKLRSLEFNIPSLKEQKDIINKLDLAFNNIEKLSGMLVTELTEISFLSKSLSEKVFSYE